MVWELDYGIGNATAALMISGMWVDTLMVLWVRSLDGSLLQRTVERWQAYVLGEWCRGGVFRFWRRCLPLFKELCTTAIRIAATGKLLS